MNAKLTLVALISSGILVVGMTTAQAGAGTTSAPSRPVTNPASLVDTRTWTSGGGNTFPGADVPFGMTQWSPDTMPNHAAGGGYTVGDTSITGYSLTHVSGPGCPAAGDLPMLPITGALPSGDPNGMTTSFTNDGEVAQAGYYSARSNQPDTITSEFTATPHTAMARFTYPATTRAGFLIKLADSQNGEFAPSTAQIVSDHEIAGSETSGHFCDETNNDGQQQEYTVHFDITFDRGFTASRLITRSGGPAAVYLAFDTTSDPTVQAKVGISYVSASNARLDWRTENPGWDFARVRAAAQQAWNKLLGRIEVSGGDRAHTQMFYSLLYKSFLHPNITSDVNGQYMGADVQVHTISGAQQNQYGIFSGWDTYHSLSQLQAMLDPKPASDQAQSLLNYYAQDGILQQFGYLHLNNYVNLGDPAQSIIADYYAFGARDFDRTAALHAMLAQATTVNDVRPGEALEQKYGYLPESASYGCCGDWRGGVPTLLEYDTADLALSFFARALGDDKDADMLEARANNWQNVFNPANNLLNPRNSNGGFVPDISPASWVGGEGFAYTYLWNVANNYQALFALLGGRSKVVPALREYLSQPNGGWPMHATLANETGFGQQYALNYAGDPAGTQQVVNNIRTTMYQPGPSGPGNDDLGANSSTFIWEMLGMYPENPGSDNLVFNSPGFAHTRITLPSGKTITNNAPGASATNFYVADLKLNGHRYHKLYVPFSTLAKGSRLDWTLTSTPTTWGSAPQDAPPSYTRGMRSVVAGDQHGAPDQVTVSPGGTAHITLGVAANATNAAQTVRVGASTPPGLTVHGTTRIPPSGRGAITFAVHADTSTPQGFHSVPITLSTHAAPPTRLNLIVIVERPGSLLPLLALDAGTTSSDVYPGFQRLSPVDRWDPGKGYGWVGTPPDSRDRGSLDALRRDLVLATTPSTLRIAVPAGRHEVYVLRGDAGDDTGDMIISAGGTTLADPGDNVSAGQFQWLHFPLDGGPAGRTADLAITAPARECNQPCYFSTGRNYWSVDALVILPSPSGRNVSDLGVCVRRPGGGEPLPLPRRQRHPGDLRGGFLGEGSVNSSRHPGAG